MTAAHEAVKSLAERAEMLGIPVNAQTLSDLSGVDVSQVPQIITDLRARGEWPEGLRVVGEEQR